MDSNKLSLWRGTLSVRDAMQAWMASLYNYPLNLTMNRKWHLKKEFGIKIILSKEKASEKSTYREPRSWGDDLLWSACLAS